MLRLCWVHHFQIISIETIRNRVLLNGKSEMKPGEQVEYVVVLKVYSFLAHRLQSRMFVPSRYWIRLWRALLGMVHATYNTIGSLCTYADLNNLYIYLTHT